MDEKSTMVHRVYEADDLADSPLRDSFDRARYEHDKLTMAHLEPEILPRGKTIEARHRLLEAIAEKVGAKREYEEWVRARELLSESTTPSQDGISTEPIKYELDPVQTPTAAGIGEMWWGRTDVSTPITGRFEMDTRFDPDGIKLFGQIRRRDGDLLKVSLKVVSQYGLSPDRMPTGIRFASEPSFELFGEVAGWTQDYWGDNWSKCWVATSQFVHGGPAGALIRQAHASRRLFNLSQDYERANVPLPGFMKFPLCNFYLDPAHPVLITLEFRFDYHLEGLAGALFGRVLPAGNLTFRETNLRLFQWTIRRIV